MRWLTRLATNRPKQTLIVVLLLLVAGIPLAIGASSQLQAGIPTTNGSDSERATKLIEERFGEARPDIVLVVTAAEGTTVDDQAVIDAGTALGEELAADESITTVTSYWTRLAPPLRSEDATQALVLATLDAENDDEAIELVEEITPTFSRETDVFEVVVGGRIETARQASEQAEEDLKRTELLTLPITLAALVIVFGGVVAALLPLGVGVLAIIATLVILGVIANFTFVSIFALNLATTLGLGLAIDYSLFIVSRFREELADGRPVDKAIFRTMQTAGRTVAFSASTVAVSMLALLVFPTGYLRSYAYAGVGVVVTAALAALLVLPSLLYLLGERVNAWPIRKKASNSASESGFWSRQARRVMRHPWPIVIGLTLGLGALAIPLLNIEPGLLDDRVLPEGMSSRDAAEDIRQNFSSRESSAITVVVPDLDPVDDAAAIDELATKIAPLDGVARVDAVTGYYLDGTVASADDLSERFVGDGGTWLSVVPSIEPFSPEGEDLVKAIRALDVRDELIVGGPSAELADAKKLIGGKLPLAIALVAVMTYILLFLMTGSLLVPAKALLLNTLSLTATFGAMVWVFQEGNLSGVLNFTPTGTLDTFNPILMFCIAFGLSMDYEVFVLSRIKEEYDLTGDNDRAVAVGLQKTGGIVTAAAALLAIVFIGLSTASVSVMKMIGLGMTIAVLVDAFIIRATLVPALMTLAGRANWWAPRWLRRFHLRFGIWESEPLDLPDR
jgi:RND superfamily putative drug exporter